MRLSFNEMLAVDEEDEFPRLLNIEGVMVAEVLVCYSVTHGAFYLHSHSLHTLYSSDKKKW